MSSRPDWLTCRGPDDWRIDGQVIRGEAMTRIWNALDWSRAWVDMGPSPSGNLGPYWHVPWDDDGEELVARLYPRLGKWLPVVRRAVEEMVSKPRA